MTHNSMIIQLICCQYFKFQWQTAHLCAMNWMSPFSNITKHSMRTSIHWYCRTPSVNKYQFEKVWYNDKLNFCKTWIICCQYFKIQPICCVQNECNPNIQHMLSMVQKYIKKTQPTIYNMISNIVVFCGGVHKHQQHKYSSHNIAVLSQQKNIQSK